MVGGQLPDSENCRNSSQAVQQLFWKWPLLFFHASTLRSWSYKNVPYPQTVPLFHLLAPKIYVFVFFNFFNQYIRIVQFFRCCLEQMDEFVVTGIFLETLIHNQHVSNVTSGRGGRWYFLARHCKPPPGVHHHPVHRLFLIGVRYC